MKIKIKTKVNNSGSVDETCQQINGVLQPSLCTGYLKVTALDLISSEAAAILY